MRSLFSKRYFAIASLFLVAPLLSCADEIGYMAKYCTAVKTYSYIDESLNTYVSNGNLTVDQISEGEAEFGTVLKKDKGEYYEYSGDFNFIALKNVNSSTQQRNYPIDMQDGYYVVEGALGNKNIAKFYIDFDGSLIRFDEIVKSVNSGDSVVRWDLCGGRFAVN